MRVQLGFINAPTEFLHLIENCFTDTYNEFSFPYRDDVIVFSSSFTFHFEHLPIFFMWLKEKGIKINLEKCNFFHMKLNFLDRIITEDGYQIDTSNISRVTSISEIPPSNIHKLRQMLELLC